MMAKKPVMALYGSIAIEKMYCVDCKTESFIKHGLLVCCDKVVEELPKKYIRETSASNKRKKPSPKKQARILEEQGNKCLYCGHTFGDIVHRGEDIIILKINWDHMLPWIFSHNNQVSNFAAACQVCNGIKSSRIFESFQKAQEHIAGRRKKKGYDF